MNKKMTEKEIKELPENTFGERLYKLRKMRGLSEEKFSEHLNCSTKTLGRYEDGYTYPRVDDVMKLCKELHVPVSYLMTNSSLEDFDIKLASINLLLKDMTPEQISYFEQLLRLYRQVHIQHDKIV